MATAPDEKTDLAVVTEFFEARGLMVERFTKAETRAGDETPDLRVKRAGALFGYCEVKSARRVARQGAGERRAR